MLIEDLEYNEEISLLGEGGKLLYDIDFDELLSRKTNEIGLIEGRTLIVVDEELNRVNLEFIISEGEEFHGPKNLGKIPEKPHVEEKPEENGQVEVNGVENGIGKKRGR